MELRQWNYSSADLDATHGRGENHARSKRPGRHRSHPCSQWGVAMQQLALSGRSRPPRSRPPRRVSPDARSPPRPMARSQTLLPKLAVQWTAGLRWVLPRRPRGDRCGRERSLAVQRLRGQRLSISLTSAGETG